MKKLFLAFICIAGIFSVVAQKPGALIDIQHYLFDFELNDSNNIIKGNAVIGLEILSRCKTITLDLTSTDTSGKGMKVTGIKENDQPLSYTHINNILNISFGEYAKSCDIKNIHISYEGIPADGLIISTINSVTELFLPTIGPTGPITGYPA